MNFLYKDVCMQCCLRSLGMLFAYVYVQLCRGHTEWEDERRKYLNKEVGKNWIVEGHTLIINFKG